MLTVNFDPVTDTLGVLGETEKIKAIESPIEKTRKDFDFARSEEERSLTEEALLKARSELQRASSALKHLSRALPAHDLRLAEPLQKHLERTRKQADFALRGLASSAAGPSWHARIVPRHSRRPGAPHRWGGTLVRTARFNGRREDAFGFDTGLDRCPRHWRDIHAGLGTHLAALGLRAAEDDGVRRILDHCDVGTDRQWSTPAHFDNEGDTVVGIEGRSVRGNVGYRHRRLQ